ncbi:hypothetical protein [Catalinimonas niigatensis]|uniref:hypothetical protein n=1 Tax=Catalinimonas niigatensis TaxID=1397264 RepID=UPI00266570E7|nr:hypothetical protein [Catalinimonas niigatensis]WPP49625.1 hypothetical protein PZB72_23405 [Catalinimonas niigatensis]
MNKSNIALLSAGLVAAGGYYLYQLKATGDVLETVTDIKLHSLNMDHAVLKANVKLINKGTTTLRIDNPQVEVFYVLPQGTRKSILTTNPQNQTVIVKPGQSSAFDLYLKTLSKAELLSIVGQSKALQLLSSGLTFLMKTKAKVNYLIPIDEEEPIVLKLF